MLAIYAGPLVPLVPVGEAYLPGYLSLVITYRAQSSYAILPGGCLMAEKHNVFISWSGARSKAAAVALNDWLPTIIQRARPWMSEEDIQKGSRGLADVSGALHTMKIGLICLTPENLNEPWILFEAGALSKTQDARVCTFLLGGLKKSSLKNPIAMFQATENGSGGHSQTGAHR